MKALTCVVGRLRDTVNIPIALLAAAGPESLNEIFAVGSTANGAGPGIDLTVVQQLNTGHIDPSLPTNTFQLSRLLETLTRNYQIIGQAVDRIGLIFADELKGRKNLFGIMFDTGFNPRRPRPGFNVLDERFTRVPREGCAIFLNAIRARRPTDGAFQRETLFTTVHELGHVFNLWHVDSFLSFLKRSSQGTPFSNAAFRFLGEHRDFLHQCAASEFVFPGGSTFGERGDLGPPDRNFFNTASSRLRLDFEIDIAQKEFWYFEPVELDISIRVRPGIAKSYRLPDQVDPGYEQFQIWIECPDGARFRYRSPRIYCQNLGDLTITPDEPFERDVSIFGQAGSYTFSQYGWHTIYAQWMLPKGSVLASNSIKVMVKKARPRDDAYREARREFVDNAKLFYHRDGPVPSHVVESLGAFARKQKNTHTGVNVHYALGRTLLNNRLGKKEQTQKKYIDEGKQYLRKALEYEGLLSPRRRYHAKRLESQEFL